jgi:beta-lactamase class A
MSEQHAECHALLVQAAFHADDKPGKDVTHKGVKVEDAGPSVRMAIRASGSAFVVQNHRHGGRCHDLGEAGKIKDRSRCDLGRFGIIGESAHRIERHYVTVEQNSVSCSRKSSLGNRPLQHLMRRPEAIAALRRSCRNGNLRWMHGSLLIVTEMILTPQRLLQISVLPLLLFSAFNLNAEDDTALESRLQSMAASHPGKIALYAEDLTTGKTVALNADTPVQTASVIKLTVLYEALEQIRAGKARFEDKITLTHDDQVTGSGILPLLDTPQTLTFRDVLTLMIVLSDNTATNLAVDHLGLKNIDDRIVSLGLKNTWLYKKVYRPPVGPMPADQKIFGLGKTTPREMAAVMKRFVTCDLNPPGVSAPPSSADRALCDAAMHMLKNQFYRNSIPRYLETQDTTEGESAIGNKTGALDAVRNDVGVVFTKPSSSKSGGPVIISEFTYANQDQSWTPDNHAEVLMARLAKQIIDTWAPR